jgi:hypothetical protein
VPPWRGRRPAVGWREAGATRASARSRPPWRRRGPGTRR